MKDLVEAILKITNESPYGWHATDSNEAAAIEFLIRQFFVTVHAKPIER